MDRYTSVGATMPTVHHCWARFRLTARSSSEAEERPAYCQVMYASTLIPAVSRICRIIITCTATVGIAGALK